MMVGLDAAGKTTVLYRLKLNEVLMTIPTIGSESCTRKDSSMFFDDAPFYSLLCLAHFALEQKSE